MAEELLERIRREISARKRSAQAAHEEYRQLERALAALDGRQAATAQPGPNRGTRRRGRGRSGGRARRGANREAILAAVRERPGLTAREIADATGIARTTAASTVTRLAGTGALERVELADGAVGFSAP